jgi:hypothetical protein
LVTRSAHRGILAALVGSLALSTSIAACVIDGDSRDLPGKLCPCSADRGYQCDYGYDKPRCKLASCRVGETLCGGRCVDTKTDISNCGGCRQACNPSDGLGVCVGGVCEIDACNAAFGPCEGRTAKGCVHTNTRNQCGSCGGNCEKLFGPPPDDAGADPKAGCRLSGSEAQCRCLSDEQCNGGQCSAHGVCKCPLSGVCHPGEHCADGGCACGTQACSDGEVCCAEDVKCHRITDDPDNCGGCGNKCPAGYACVPSTDGVGHCACASDAGCGAGADEFRCDNGVCVCGADAHCQMPSQRCEKSADFEDICK